MRFHEIAGASDLDTVYGEIADYIQNNSASDLASLSDALRQHGYVDPFGAGHYYRALFHQLTPEDKKLAHTVGELAPMIKDRMRLGGAQGFTTSVELAFDFVRGTLHISHNNPPDHRMDTPVNEVSDMILIYEVQAPASSILFSMRGLKKFMRGQNTGPGWDALDHSMNDIWDGYGSDDEVVIDTAQVKIIQVHVYDSDED